MTEEYQGEDLRFSATPMKASRARLDFLKTKKQRAGLTPDEKLELTALEDFFSSSRTDPKPLSTSVDKSHVKSRISGREAGEQICQVIATMLQGFGGDQRSAESFFRVINDRYCKEIFGLNAVRDQQMFRDEAQSWGDQTIVTFGRHEGSRVSDVPIEYLEWLDQDEFRKQLRRYLSSGVRNLEQGEQSDE